VPKILKTLFLALVILLLAAPASLVNSIPVENYRYYFYAPSNQLLLVIGLSDNTSLRLYNLSRYGLEKNAVWSGSVNRMGRVVIPVSRGFYVLHASSRVAAALCLDWNSTRNEGGFFYPATTGGFVGKEFIFLVFDYGEGIPTVYAFEDAEVKVYDASGNLVEKHRLWQNDTRTLHLFKGSMYRIVSTGRIAVIQMSDDRIMMAVSPYGGFKGRWLIGGTHHSCGIFAAVAYRPCKVVVEDAKRRIKVQEHAFTPEEVDSGRPWSVGVRLTLLLKFTSNAPITVLTGEDGDELDIEHMVGVAIASVKAGEEFRVYAPSGLVIFVLEDGKLEVDGAEYTASAGQYLTFERGTHIIKPESNLIIEIIGNRGSSIYSAPVPAILYLLSDKDVDLKLPPLQPSEKAGGGVDYSLIIALAMAAILVAIGVLVGRIRK